jgi:hypothetical protein
VAWRRLPGWLPTVLAGALASIAALAGWRGVDFPAQLYRVGLFHRDGLVIWDSRWYGGHWTFDYSVLFPPLAGTLGIQITAILSAATAAFAFDRLVVGHFALRARPASLLFAVGTLAPVAIGQLPFLLGEALALAACLAATRRRWLVAAALATGAGLASPLAGAFLGLTTAAWLIASWRTNAVGLGIVTVASLAPVAITAAVFPGEGAMPFPATDFAQLAAVFAVLWFLIPRRERALRIGAAVYLGAIAACFVLASPVGGNISRLGEGLGAPLAMCLLWPRRRWFAVAAVVPLVALQWSPAFAVFGADRSDPSTNSQYFAPLLQFLETSDRPLGRVEVVPTRLHWEAAYVASRFPLARGWERQLDIADDPLFYDHGALNVSTYRAWLLDNGVRYIALPDVPVDYAAVGERRLLEAGVPGLGPPQRIGRWRVYDVAGAPGLVDGPGQVTSLDGSQMTVDAQASGSLVLRVRYDPRWTVVNDGGCLEPGPGQWTTLSVRHPGEFKLALRLLGDRDGGCSQ